MSRTYRSGDYYTVFRCIKTFRTKRAESRAVEELQAYGFNVTGRRRARGSLGNSQIPDCWDDIDRAARYEQDWASNLAELETIKLCGPAPRYRSYTRDAWRAWYKTKDRIAKELCSKRKWNQRRRHRETIRGYQIGGDDSSPGNRKDV